MPVAYCVYGAVLQHIYVYSFSFYIFVRVQISNKLDRSTLIAGCELGLWTFLGFGLQAVGLETTTASRSGFLLYLNVKASAAFEM
jgi:hypothetical protein